MAAEPPSPAVWSVEVSAPGATPRQAVLTGRRLATPPEASDGETVEGEDLVVICRDPGEPSVRLTAWREASRSAAAARLETERSRVDGRAALEVVQGLAGALAGTRTVAVTFAEGPSVRLAAKEGAPVIARFLKACRDLVPETAAETAAASGAAAPPGARSNPARQPAPPVTGASRSEAAVESRIREILRAHDQAWTFREDRAGDVPFALIEKPLVRVEASAPHGFLGMDRLRLYCDATGGAAVQVFSEAIAAAGGAQHDLLIGVDTHAVPNTPAGRAQVVPPDQETPVASLVAWYGPGPNIVHRITGGHDIVAVHYAGGAERAYAAVRNGVAALERFVWRCEDWRLAAAAAARAAAAAAQAEERQR